jgi:uncharacterized protein DUF4340
MNYKTTLILVLLLAIVGAYFYFFEFGKISGYEAHQQQQSQSTDVPEGVAIFEDLAEAVDSINRIEIVRGGQAVTLSKEEDRWYQTEPVRFPLNDYMPRSIAQKVAELRYLKRVTPGETDAPTLEMMGLDTPRAVVTVRAGEVEKSLRLGKLTLGGHAYIQVEGEDTAYVVNSIFYGAVLDETVNDWRSTTLDIPQASGAQRAYLYQADGDDIFLEKIDGRWRFDAKSVQRVNQGEVDSWFSSAGQVRIDAFVEDNPSSLQLYRLDDPHLRIKFSEVDGAGAEITHTLHIGNADLKGSSRYAAWTRGDEPVTVVFIVNAASAEVLARTFTDLRDPRVITADVYGVRELTVEQDGHTTLHLIRDPQSGYSFGDPVPGFGADYSASHNMVQKLCELESTRYADAITSLGTPIASVQITLAGNENSVNFDVYSQEEDRVIVSEGESVGYLVSAGELDTLLGQPIGLRDRALLDIEPTSIARMTLRRDDDQLFTFEPIATDDQAASWRLAGHGDYESEAFDTLIKSLNPLRVQRWLAEPVAPTAGWIEWTIEPVGGAPVTLKADPATGEALMSGVDSAFVLPQSMISMLTAEYRKRTVLSIGIDQIESVRIASDLTSVTLSRDGQRYTINVGEVDQALAATVFDTLSGLQARRYVAPLSLRPEDIDFTIELTTPDGETVTLRVVRSEGVTATVTIDGPRGEGHMGWFELSGEAINRLRAPLTEAEAPIK